MILEQHTEKNNFSVKLLLLIISLLTLSNTQKLEL